MTEYLILIELGSSDDVEALDGCVYECIDEARSMCELARSQGWDAFVVAQVGERYQ